MRGESSDGETLVKEADSFAQRLAKSSGISKKPIHVHTTIMKVLTPEIFYPGIKRKGEPSYMSKTRTITTHEALSLAKKHGKNTMRPIILCQIQISISF